MSSNQHDSTTNKKKKMLLDNFLKENVNFVKDPIIQNFLQKNNLLLLEEALYAPSKENQKRLDDAFREFYSEIRIKKYLSNLIYFNSILFDKNLRKNKEGHPLILDAPIQGSDEDTPLIEIFTSNKWTIDSFALEKENNLDELISEPILYKAIKSLTSTEKTILDYAYIHNMSDVNIAKIRGVSQQAISKTRKKALLKLHQKLKDGDSNDI